MKRLLLCIILLYNTSAHADVYGSDTAVSALPAFTAPAAPAIPNRIAYFGWTQNGFTLTDNTTSLLFDSVFPVSGTIQMNGGTLNLNRDLIMNNLATLQGLGQIVGAAHILSLAQSINALPLNTQSFNNTRLTMNSDITLKSAITFSSTGTGFCSIQGNGHVLSLAAGSSMSITGTLQLHNVIIEGIAGTNVQCTTSNSFLLLDNVTWIQTSTYTFGAGSFQCENKVIFRGQDTAFVYQSNQPSLINTDATLLLDTGLTFSYAPVNSSSQSLLAFTDPTSLLILNGATLSTTTTGITLTQGSLLVQGNSFISTPTVATAITLGNGISALNDMATTIAACGNLTVANGALNYMNVASSSWIMENSVSILELGYGTVLRLFDTLNLGIGIAVFNDQTILQRMPNAFLLGSIQTLGVTTFQII
jgi:hypothetical protein